MKKRNKSPVTRLNFRLKNLEKQVSMLNECQTLQGKINQYDQDFHTQLQGEVERFERIHQAQMKVNQSFKEYLDHVSSLAERNKPRANIPLCLVFLYTLLAVLFWKSVGI